MASLLAELLARAAEVRALLAAEREQVADRPGLERLRARLVGRKGGLLTALMDDFRRLPREEKAGGGAALNQLKQEVEGALDAVLARVEEREAVARQARAAGGAARLTLPGRTPPRGTAHPLSLVRDELEAIFLELGYAVADGPEVEDDFHNFAALNMPPDHPARDMQDTFYLGADLCLRTHTSNVQIHTLERTRPPLRVVSMGRCYRRDAPDATHSPMFHQIEGLAVDGSLTMADLKGTLEVLSRRLFGATAVRLRPSYFPFTEPSAELDISCFACDRGGCPLCKGSGFIELGGCGMVDPNVFTAVGLDPERWRGFAFGFGLERAAILKWGIDDIRLLFEGDLRFLAQFPAPA